MYFNVCNRYAIRNLDNVERWVKEQLDPECLDVIRRIGVKFTASPTNQLPVIIPTGSGKPQGQAMKWGVWFTDSKGKRSGPYMNAKKELALKNWRENVQYRRCVVPADAFFEWPPDPPKTPWMFTRPLDMPFGFAGVFTPELTFAFLTTDPSSATRGIGHKRSPVILTESNVARWIAPGDLTVRDVEAFAVPYEGALRVERVTMRMNRTGYNQPDAVIPLSLEEIAQEAGTGRIVSAELPNGDQLPLF